MRNLLIESVAQVSVGLGKMRIFWVENWQIDSIHAAVLQCKRRDALEGKHAHTSGHVLKVHAIANFSHILANMIILFALKPTVECDFSF